MVRSISTTLAAGLFLASLSNAEGLYSKDSGVVIVSGASYDNLIAKSNHTSILEFYAPWCGHCKNLKPAYEKAAKSLSGLAKVAAINCDEESNKPFCGSMGVQGFPTLKIVKPGKKAGKPVVEDYQGPRTAKAIVDAVIDNIPNHVKRLKDDDYEAWLNDGEAAKAILFSDKGTTSALLKAIAIDFLGGIDVAQIRDKEKEAVEKFNVEKFPTLLLVPGKGKDATKHNGEMKKAAMVAFLSQAAAPNPDPAPKKAKASSTSKSDKSKASKDSSSFAKASESQASAQVKSDKASQTAETLEDQSQPTESPDPKVVADDTPKPVEIPEVAPIPSIPDELTLQHKCLNSKGGTCLLALLPEDVHSSTNAKEVLASLSEIRHKHESAKRHLFPFFQLSNSNPVAETLREKLGLGDGVELVTVNGKRAFYRHYTKTSFGLADVDEWIDAIRMDQGSKEKMPENLIVNYADLLIQAVTPEKKGSEDKKAPESKKAPEDKKGPEAMKEALKAQMPEGVEFELEEINDDDYQRIIAEASKSAQEHEAKKTEDAKPEKEKVHIIDEL